MKDLISEQFGVTPMIKKSVVPKTQQVADDFNTARENLLSVIAQGGEALSTLLMLADQSQSDRYYKVVSEMIDSLVSANKELLALQKQMRDITKDDTSLKPTTTLNNLFVGTSDDLLKIIRGEAK